MLKKRLVDDETTGLTDQEIWYRNNFLIGGGHMSIYFFIHCLLTKKFRALRIGTIENKKKIDMSLLFIENISVLLRHNSCTIKVTL